MAMTPDEFLFAMEKIRDDPTGDIESDHSNADALMCKLLVELGYEEGVKVYKALEKWYS